MNRSLLSLSLMLALLVGLTPLSAQVWRTSAASNQPQRRLRAVTVPNS